MTDFIETADGLRHLLSPIGGGEHTLCGASYDAHETVNEPGWAPVPLTGNTVTCPECAAVVLACRGMRVKPLARSS